jgi:K+-sensing histidine kinase KdpD
MSNEHSRLDEKADSAITRARARADEERRQTDGDLTGGRAEPDEVLSRDEVFMMVSHDLRSMLSSIMGMASSIDAAR